MDRIKAKRTRLPGNAHTQTEREGGGGTRLQRVCSRTTTRGGAVRDICVAVSGARLRGLAAVRDVLRRPAGRRETTIRPTRRSGARRHAMACLEGVSEGRAGESRRARREEGEGGREGGWREGGREGLGVDLSGQRAGFPSEVLQRISLRVLRLGGKEGAGRGTECGGVAREGPKRTCLSDRLGSVRSRCRSWAQEGSRRPPSGDTTQRKLGGGRDGP